ncbi:hypothetical protein DL771_001481 [Monosporascus sp. 5C6A]|nr:hypothetical protein DL771_001481 [Monosporascus sp. 5C6A]
MDFREYPSADTETVDEAILKLFLILSTWLKPNVAPHGGLTLEISIYSPSDSQHTFSGDLHFGPDPFETEDDERQRLRTHDPYHGWRHGRRLGRPLMQAISEILNITEPKFRKGLPSVKVVTSLILRRQTRRALSANSLQKIFKSLPGLECINYEPWREFFRCPQYHQDRGYQNIILTSLPETLKTLTIFEDFNEDYNIVHCFHYITREWPYPPELVRTPNPSVGAALAYRSLGLERLSASYIVDAKDFFRACEPKWMWDNLTSLTLTSPLLTLCKPHPFAINKMLVDAGTAALRMPQLRTMVIWNGMKRNACAFRYQVTANSTTLGWCGTWDLELDIDVLDVWRKAALRYTRHELSILASRNLNKQDIQSHAVAIRELNLRYRHTIAGDVQGSALSSTYPASYRPIPNSAAALMYTLTVLNNTLEKTTTFFDLPHVGLDEPPTRIPQGSSNPKRSLHNIAYALGALTASGGTIGFVKTGSVPSIAAGLTVGLLYGLGGYRIQSRQPWGVELALLASVVLGGSSIPRAIRLGKPVPTVLSVLSIFGMVMFGNAFRKSL